MSEKWLLKGNFKAPIKNVRDGAYKKSDFLKIWNRLNLQQDPDPTATRFLACQYAIRVELMIRILGEQNKDFLLRFPLSRELNKLEKKFSVDSLNPGEKWNEGHWTANGNTDWEWGAETFSERFRDFLKQVASFSPRYKNACDELERNMRVDAGCK